MSRTDNEQPWPRGRCEFWMDGQYGRTMCGKRGRWLIHGQILCGEHRRA